jgi:flagellar L-ring protein precursor FlgH
MKTKLQIFLTKAPRVSALLPHPLAVLLFLAPITALSQSLWHDDASRSMFADKRAMGVGDIINVMISETSTETKNNETKTEKSSSLTEAITSFLFPQTGLLQYKGQMPALQYNSDLKHDGTGAINNTEQVVAQIAVRVVDVLPNGNFVIEGRRETAFSGEHQTIVLHGTVRPDDITSADTVYSYNVADASIQIIGKGVVTDNQNMGWFNRIWSKINPF